MNNNGTILKNTKTPQEAMELLEKENIKVLGDAVVYYMQYKEDIDTLPDQLISGDMTAEEEMIKDMETYVTVVAVGDEVTRVQPGDKLFFDPRLLGSSTVFYVGGLAFPYVSQRHVFIIKKQA